MELSKKSIDQAIRDGVLKKCRYPELSEMHYFVDATGRIISYNKPEPREVVSHAGRAGEQYVSLYTNDGLGRYTVAQLVASAFLEQPPGKGYRLERNDNDVTNNSPDNLYWELDVRVAADSEAAAPDPNHGLAGTTKPPNRTDQLRSAVQSGGREIDLPPHAKTPNDGRPQEVNKTLRDERDAAIAQNKRLLVALRPFAEFELPRNFHLSTEDRIVLEANTGHNNQCALHVSDFVRAADEYGD